MSSAPARSPPRTPPKSGMANGNENLNAAPRTPLPDAPSRNTIQTSMNPPVSTLKLSQTPAPQPISESLLGKSGEQKLPGPGNRGGKLDERHSDHPAEDAEHDDERSSNGQATAHDINTELEPIDWEDFDQRYGAKLDQAAAIEEEIHEEFKMLCQSFTYWASAATNFDETRGWKRLKTRQRYVQMAETSLIAKKEHYVQVVEAFKAALKLLGEPKE